MVDIVVDPKPADYRPVAQMPALTSAEIASARHKFVEVYKDSAAFDQAAAKDGINIKATSAEAAKDRREMALAPASAKLDDFKIELANASQIDPDHFQDTITELRTFAKDMALSPSLGSAVVDRVSQLGPTYAAKTPDEQKAWVSERVNEMARIISEPKLDELRKNAQDVLRERGGKFGQALANSPVLLNDLWLLRTLAGHATNLQAFEKKHGRR
jgi:hypothetical protein